MRRGQYLLKSGVVEAEKDKNNGSDDSQWVIGAW